MRVILSVIFLLAALTKIARSDPADLCISAAISAAAQHNIPLPVLMALTLTETGRRGADGGLEPWAWALNQGGESLWFNSRDEALAHLDAVIAAGITNIDIGCFQVNLRWHGAAFSSAEAMMDPQQNAEYAAQHLVDLYSENGSWGAAVSAYHSTTPAHAEKYMARYEPIYAGLEAIANGTVVRPPVEATRANAFPLLRAGTAQGRGSIVPLPGLIGPLIGDFGT